MQPVQAGLVLPVTSFVGREQEIAEVRRLLATSRLLTLTGPGGVGKTRLALRVAAEIQVDNASNVALVELAALTDPELVPQSVASALKVSEQPGRPPLDVLADVLRLRQLLLVLDNCEHLVVACAMLADTLLRNCRELRILATSREVMGVAGETAWQVPTLSLPNSQQQPRLEQVAQSEAVRLFVDRAQAALPSFVLGKVNAAAVAKLCCKLDGIPLALELAAARVPVLSVEQIAKRLDDAIGLLTTGVRHAPARQRTLRATLEWSYQLLSKTEQQLFERLAVFAGGWTFEAVETICAGREIKHDEVLDLLASVIAKSLVLSERHEQGPVRYRLLETIRQYGQQKLAERGEADTTSDRHAAYFLALAERVQPELLGPGETPALAYLEREHENVRAALRWLLQQGAADRAQRLAGAFGRFWWFRGYFTEGESWLAQALALPGGDAHTVGRARCLYGLGALALSRGAYGRAELVVDEARHLWHALGDAGEEAFALVVMADVARRRGDQVAARRLLNTAVDMSHAAGAQAAEVAGLRVLAEMACELDDDREARRQAELALTRAMQVGWKRGLVVTRRTLGRVRARQGDFAAAIALFEASLADSRELGAHWHSAQTLVDLGQLAIEHGDLRRARRWLAESLTHAQGLGDRPDLARGFEAFAQLAVIQRQWVPALQLAGAAARLGDAIQTPQSARVRAERDQRLSPARAALGPEISDALIAEGSLLSTDQVVGLALGLPEPRTAVLRPDPFELLTAREREVAALIAHGLSNRQIAERLVIATGTAERHVANILSKLHVDSRSQIAAWAVEHDLARSPGSVGA